VKVTNIQPDHPVTSGGASGGLSEVFKCFIR